MAIKEVLDFVIALTAVLAWPVTVLAVALAYRGSIRLLPALARNAPLPDEPVNFKAANVALANLAAASVAPKFVDGYEQRSPELLPIRPKEFISITSKFSRHDLRLRLEAANILWVDGNPENNIFEQNAFATFNIKIVSAAGAEQAIALLRGGARFDLIISDIKRNGSALEGYRLIDRLNESALGVPVVIYSLATDEVRRAEARLSGALDRVGTPVELFNVVMAELTKAKV